MTLTCLMRPSVPATHFLALRPDGATRDRLQAISDRLRAWELPAGWVHPEDYHLTVLFLGPLPDDEAGWLPHAIADLAAGIRRPELRLAGLGATGTRGQGTSAVPHRVHAAVTDPAGACRDLHLDLAAALDGEIRHDYAPHLTLCRPLPHPPHPQVFRDWPHLLEANGIADWGPCTVDALALYRSGPGTPRYVELAQWPLC